MRTLKTGFSTLRDAGSSGEEMYTLRDTIAAGWIDGPRIVAARGVGICGCHADISGVKPLFMELYTDSSICDGPPRLSAEPPAMQLSTAPDLEFRLTHDDEGV